MKSPYKSNSLVFSRRLARRSAHRGVLTVLGVAGALVLASCGGATGQLDAVAAPAAGDGQVSTLPASAPVVSGAQGMELLEQGAILIDVRTPGEYDEVRIEGAMLIDVSSPDFDALVSELDPTETYVVYCRSGNRSVPATQRMMQLGLGSVYDMGGIIDWVAEGHPTVSG
jgi:rhodanese-related sulfurtransferase